MDIATAPILDDITVDGKPIKAVAIMGKQAMVYVFDRATGQPVWPIEERPVPQGDVPGEKYSPTQPFPDQAAAVRSSGRHDRQPDRLHARAARGSGQAAVAVQARADLHAAAGEQGRGARLPAFRSSGGTNWPGGSFDPETHVAYVPSFTSLVPVGLLPPPSKEFSDAAYVLGTVITGVRYITGPGENAGADAPPPARSEAQTGGETGDGAGNVNPQGLPFLKPPYGRITAIDLDRGEFVWQVAHGETPDSVRNHPALKGLNIPRTGQSGAVGALVTKTLVIAGEPLATTLPDRRAGRNAARVRQGDRQGSRRRLHAGAAERHRR